VRRAIPILVLCGLAAALFAQLRQADRAKLQQRRALGKALYENPTTQKEAVEQFKAALDLSPSSAREQLNYALALLRAGDTARAITLLEQVQKLDPKLPHTWFNLGVTLQKQGEFDRAFAQFQKFVELVPAEPVGHYHLGTLNKLRENPAAAIKAFETARDLNPRLAAPHFQLYGMYRQQNRTADSAAELKVFQEIKKQQEGAAVPEDMDWCSYAEVYDPIDLPPPAPLPPPQYRDTRVGQGFTGFVATRLDGGPRAGLIAWSAERVAAFRFGTTEIPKVGLEDLRDVVSIAPGDFDGDGLQDLAILTSKSVILYRNQREKYTKTSEIASGSYRKAVWLDFDHDYDQDLVLLGDQPRLYRNNGAAGWSDETRRFPFVAGKAVDAVRFDLEPDTPGFDLVVSYQDRPGVVYRDSLGGNYKASDLKELTAGATGLAAVDRNRDGWTDLTAAPDLMLVNAHGTFRRESGAAAPEVRADFTGKGRLDRVHISDGALMVGRDVSTNYGNWIEVALEGVKSPKVPINARVEVKSADSYEKASYEGLPLVFRLGNRTSVDTVRITWPNGLVQNEINQPVNRVMTYKEAPRLSGSCPMIFTWNGKRFEFLTDVLGVAPLGAGSGDGEFFPVDHDEYVTIPGDKLALKDGQYEIRVTEELREVSYLDQIQLIAVDHPAATGFVTNEKFKAPPFPEFRLYGIDRKVYPVGNASDALRRKDRVYPDAFRRDAQGMAELHTLDLDFGRAAQSNRAVLVLDGWVDWPDASTFRAASQAQRDLVFPYIQVKDGAGNWKTVIEDMGIPSGKPKAMAVDLSGKFLSDSREVRIVTSLCVYWDEIFLVEDNAATPSRLTPLKLAVADLHFRGFSRPTIHPERKQPEHFDYSTVSPTTTWNPTPGDYTRYGDASDLLSNVDDRLVVMGSGDEVALRFDPAGLPPLAEGWQRDFLLLVDGWAKDGDANTAFSQSVLPLPFHGMSRYPYPAGENPPLRDSRLTRPALRLLRPLAADGYRSGAPSHDFGSDPL
jgi:tetratricopeptide (TPR) repeat protein